MLYLDHAAATPVSPAAARAALHCAQTLFFNPSSPYPPSDDARRALNQSRQTLAAHLNAQSDEIIFVSGATEANNLAIQGFCRASKRGGHLIVSAMEHPSVLQAALALKKEGFAVTQIYPGRDGRISLGALESALKPETVLVSIQLANHETGVLQPVEELACLLRERGVAYHCDATSGFGHIKIDLEKTPISLLTAAGHKLGGLHGAGLLYKRNAVKLTPLFYGGTQEFGLRPGSQNLPAIVGFAAAMQEAPLMKADEAQNTAALRDLFEQCLAERIPGCRINGGEAPRLAHYSSVTFPGVSGEQLLIRLARRGVYASARAACATLESTPSPTLLAMGLSPQDADSTLRFTLGRANTAEEMRFAADSIASAVGQLVN
jgi:cysteine desulfurase